MIIALPFCLAEVIMVAIKFLQEIPVKEECLICKAPLEYLERDELMECAICHKKENSKTRCVNGWTCIMQVDI